MQKYKSGSRKAVLECIAIILLCGCDQKFDYNGVRLNLRQKTLANGLSMILIEDHSAPVIAYQTWFRVGSSDERIGNTGVTHLFEHLLFKGTPRYKARQFFEQLESKGAEVNAYTTRDYTVFYETFPKEMISQVIDMESDRMANFKPTEDLLKNEKMIVFEEKRLRYEHAPESKLEEALWQLAFHLHSYQSPIMGYPFDIDRLTLSQAEEHYKNFFQPENATLVVVGDFALDQTEKIIRAAYGAIPSKKVAREENHPEPEQTEERRLILREPVDTEKFLLGYHICSASDPDSFSLDILSSILFEGVHSRVYQSLVVEKDLALEVTGTAFTPLYPGLFIISGTMKKGRSSGLAEKEIHSLIRKIQDQGVTEEEIKVGLKQLEVQWADHVRTPFGLAQWVGTHQTLFKNVKRLQSDLLAYKSVSSESIKKVANRYLNPNNRSVVTMVPKEKS